MRLPFHTERSRLCLPSATPVLSLNGFCSITATKSLHSTFRSVGRSPSARRFPPCWRLGDAPLDTSCRAAGVHRVEQKSGAKRNLSRIGGPQVSSYPRRMRRWHAETVTRALRRASTVCRPRLSEWTHERDATTPRPQRAQSTPAPRCGTHQPGSGRANAGAASAWSLRPSAIRWPIVLLFMLAFAGGGYYVATKREPTWSSTASINVGRTDVRVQALPGYVQAATPVSPPRIAGS